MSLAIDKNKVLSELRRLLEADLDVITASQQDAQAGATHQEAKQEGDKDMRATETSYLARGLAKRVTELRSAVAQLASLQLRQFDEDSAVALTALVQVEDGEGLTTCYFIAPTGGGMSLELGSARVSVITPTSPLGRALLGRGLDDEVELRSPQGLKLLTITELC